MGRAVTLTTDGEHLVSGERDQMAGLAFQYAVEVAHGLLVVAKGVVDGSLGAWELVYPTKLSEVTKFHAQPAPGVAHPTATVLTVFLKK